MKAPWYELAKLEIGQREVKGGENKRIIEYHSTTSLKGKEDEIPWCSSFVNWCVEEAGYHGSGSAAAVSWLNWGERCEPKQGAICVIKQKSSGKDAATGSSSGYHVGFLVEIPEQRIRLLGGNQSDSVKETGFGRGSYQVVGYRWPTEKQLKREEA